ncbi:N-acetylglucosamine-6-phosphate deacetylase [Microbacterium sorbitolivorans]|uniref:N-acetylglucosamine-6-phosphate deacetylase n=1 Tax=Microbacterium sorbitolivorans TaxID=1867410 RepID=A0A367Y850_9MICO|nr:N-acetylglucosamine-6-phosphate deacetylase [Microbacterium sorbitolivorans]RCK62008.1 N-acetylglucosamine-6-phosphate deacetylase [Microbacterium sorbitolivorans]GGF43894.1 N-acetylglucosamine-6-phosphate deacetylase [Microbacterium sorbitolivorans]
MTVIHSARLITSGTVTENAWVRFDGDRVAEIGSGTGWPADADVVDAAGGVLTPGFVDIHVHGGGTASYDGDAAQIAHAMATHHEHGTTRTALSLVTATQADLRSQLALIADLASDNPLILGSHLEGPYLDHAHKGAHAPELLADPQAEDIDALLAAARGTLVQITLAPEKPGAMAAIPRLVEAGVAVAVGHTAAGYEQALAAFDAGASLLTHAFNAMDGIYHRAPGPIGAALARDHVTLELINDGVHVHPAVAKMLWDAAPGRVALITDAMAAAGAADGDYVLGSLAVRVERGTARLVEGGAIAGSTLTLDAALRQSVDVCGVSLVDAVDALTRVPADAIGRRDIGRLEAGAAADAVLLTEQLEVTRVWGAGNALFTRAA